MIDSLELVGNVIDGKYRVESVVGEGGFASVYKATHLVWKRPVALKVFRALGSIGERERQSLLDAFTQEGALLAELSERTTGICQARDAGAFATARGERIPYIVLEWLEGTSLAERLEVEAAQKRAPRTIAEAVALLSPAAEALALAHRRGIAHRDVKPANIFIVGTDGEETQSVKLLDFGIAKVVSDAWTSAGGLGKTTGQVAAFTPAYGAPEQFSRERGATGPWTDVFALALVLVEVVSGRAPLEGDDLAQLAVASSDPSRRPTPRALGVAVSDAVESVFAKALAVDPAQRFSTVMEMWSALADALGMEVDHGSWRNVPASGGRRTPRLTTSNAETILAGDSAAPLVAATAPKRSRRAWIAAAAGAVAIGGALTFAALRAESNDAGGRTSGAPRATQATSATLPVPAPVFACPAGMVRVPGGPFFMGDDDGEPAERPAHQVRIDAFCMDRFEVTVAQYKACSDAGGCKRASQTNAWDGITSSDSAAFDPLCNVRDPEAKASHPINCVDWDMADKFCREQGKRLPTEAEWELAARGQDGRRYPWGDEAPGASLLNACGSECLAWGRKHRVDEQPMYATDDHWPTTAPVGSFPKGASPYGVEDIVGNVWEWVADYYAEYPSGELRNPKGPSSGAERVIRGGAWNGAEPSWVRPSFRYKDAPEKRSYGIGFRCAK